LSLTFANNVGPDNLLVLTASNATMSGAGCAVVGTTPCPFAGSIAFTTPFPYNPANGSLLLDLKATSFSGSGQFDVIDCSAPACVSSAVHGSPLGSATGTPNGGGGNIVQFTFTAGVSATPVPPSILLTLIGLACVGFYVGRRGTKFA
jgi:hypothetical protein